MELPRTPWTSWRPEPWLGVTGAWRLAGLALVVVLIAAVGVLVYYTGGTSTAYLNLILIPVILSAALFGWRGGLLFGLLAGLVLGPFMPIDTATGEPQPLLNWVTRATIYVVLGGFTGWLFTRLNHHARQLLERARSNPVTGLPNRQALEGQLHQRIRGAEASNAPAVRIFVVGLQLDNYQDTIGALGLGAEQPLLCGVARRLEAVGERLGAQVYHLHDDQFTLMLADSSQRENLAATRQAVECLQTPFDVEGIPVYLGAHAGVASFPFHEQDDPERLLTKAWMATREAGQAGRRYRTYNRRRGESSRRAMERLGELQQAMDQGQLLLHYQPKIDVQEGTLLGAEGLLRWQHPRYGAIAPGEFIPQAECTGLIDPLTRHVLELALNDLSTLWAEGLRVHMSINVSARNFLDPTFVDHILATVDAAGIAPGALELEFTETALMDDPEEVIGALQRLANTGIELSIDDFGTGYSSMTYLQRLPVSALKIDQSFVRQMLERSVDAQIVRASIGLAADLGLQSIAEGVEDAATLARLRELGCDVAQGFGIARPMPLDQLRHWARDHQGATA